MFTGEQLKVIRNEDSLTLPAELDAVFDFGGWIDERTESIAEQFDVVVVPVCYQSKAELYPCVRMINTLNGLNSNVAVLINNTDTKEAPEVERVLRRNFPGNRIFIVNRSKFICRLADEGKTIGEIARENPLYKYNLKNLTAQLDEFHKYLDGVQS